MLPTRQGLALSSQTLPSLRRLIDCLETTRPAITRQPSTVSRQRSELSWSRLLLQMSCAALSQTISS